MPVQNPTEQVYDESLIPVFTVSLWGLLLYFAIVSLLGVLLMMWDRHQAKKKGNRVGELRMMALGLLGGAAAMWGYMSVTRHKIRYAKFRIGLPIMAGLHALLWALLLIYNHPHMAIEVYAVHMLVAYVAMNLLGIFITRADKRRAQRDMWRVPEDVLMLIAILGGALGMYFGMLLMHHKTRYLKFMLGLPLIFAVHVAIFAWMQSEYCNVFFIWFP